MKAVKIILSIFLGVLTAPTSIAQDLMAPIGLKVQIENSDTVIEGLVVEKSSFLNGGHIFTRNTIRVVKTYKGTSPAVIELITKGGFIALKGEVVNPSLQLSVGDRGVFLLVQNDDLSFDTFANKQSFYRFNELDATVSNPFEEYQSYDEAFVPVLLSTTKQTPKVIDASIDRVLFKIVKRSIAGAITSFTPTSLSAGTFTVLTINGSGFGTTKGDVLFSNADDGGKTAIYVLKSLITSWTDTQIKVKVPFEAGTGNIAVKTSSGTVMGATQPLTISYSQINLPNGNGIYPTYHVNRNNLGGYTWEMNKDFYANSDAKAAFERAFNAWKCAVGINWNISNTTTTLTAISDDGHNVITFTNALGTGVLGECTNYYSGGYNSNNELMAYVTGFDIGFKSTVNWNYSSSAPTATQFDFESTVLHELGHGLQLHHVIAPNELMHYYKGVGSSFRTITTAALIGAKDIISRDLSANLTNVAIKITLFDTSTCSLNNVSFTQNNFIIYPNPSTGFFTIQAESEDAIQVTVVNLIGETVYQSTSNEAKLIVDIKDVASGVYIVKIKTKEGLVIKKIVKE